MSLYYILFWKYLVILLVFKSLFKNKFHSLGKSFCKNKLELYLNNNSNYTYKMKCSMCNKVPEFICLCNYTAFCEDHLGRHMIEQVEHNLERLDDSLDNLESQNLKTVALLRIQNINKSKKEIYLLAKTLIEKTEKSCKQALEELNSLSKFYSTLLNLQKSSKSLTLKVKNILDTTMIIKIDNCLETPFNRNFVKFVKKIQEDEFSRGPNLIDNISNKQKKEIESKELEGKKHQTINNNVQEKDKKPENYLIKGGIHSKVRNSWSLADKQEYMETLKIEDYQDVFSRTGTNKFPISEIMFSYDEKYCFICKKY